MSNDSNNPAFRLDRQPKSIYEQLGADKIIAISTAFYTRVYADDDEEFRTMFQSPIEEAIRDQYEFFIQRFGGPSLFSQRKGHPALRGRHARFPITSRMVERWLFHMNAALDEVGLQGEMKSMVYDFMANVANFLQDIDGNGKRIYGK